jgi:hypothetical protein
MQTNERFDCMYASSMPEFTAQNILEVVFKGFRGSKLVLRKAIFKNVTNDRCDEMIGSEWKCYDSLRHFELSEATGLTQQVMMAITKHLSRMK